MRAGLIAGALLALAATEPAFGQAEVPCTRVLTVRKKRVAGKTLCLPPGAVTPARC